MEIAIYFPILLLVLGSLGLGGLLLHVWRDALPAFPLWLRAAIAYFAGQGVLAALLLAIALAGDFGPRPVWRLLVVSAVPLAWLLWRSRSGWLVCLRRVQREFGAATLGWKVLAAIAAWSYLYGFGTLAGMPAGDAQSFYLPISKATAYARQLIPLPGYEEFSSMVGLYAEILVAALIRLGVPYHLARIYSWVNYLPTLLLLWGLAGMVGLSRRGRLLTVCVALTSSAVILLWGGGKTDLFAVGPAFACCLFALTAWKRRTRTGATVIAGLFCGYAVVLKMSLLVVLLPTALLLLEWPALFDLATSVRRRSGRRVAAIIRRGAIDLGLFGLGLVPMFLPHVAKSLWFGGSIFGFGQMDTAWYSAETVRHLVLTYPLALTYGRYWGQYGNLSPLVLGFLPLLAFLPRPRAWRTSRLTAIAMATLTGLSLWIVLIPAVFMPRYILSSLIMLGIPAAAAADYFSRRGAAAGLAVMLATAVTIHYTPDQANTWLPRTLDWLKTWQQLANPGGECLAAGDMHDYCQAQQAINAAASAEDRVMIISWYRLWISADLLLHANTGQDTIEFLQSGDRCTWLRAHGFRFVLLDTGYPGAAALPATLPKGCGMRRLYNDPTVSAYEILPLPTAIP